MIDSKSHPFLLYTYTTYGKEQHKGVALVTVLIFTLIFILIVGALLGLMYNQVRISEHQIRRIKAYYTAWAGLWHAMEEIRGGSLGPWAITLTDEYNTPFTAEVDLTGTTLNSTVDYTR